MRPNRPQGEAYHKGKILYHLDKVRYELDLLLNRDRAITQEEHANAIDHLNALTAIAGKEEQR